MKKYLLFSFDHYDPSGGFDDCCGLYDSIDEAKKYVVYEDDYGHHIVDFERFKVVSRYDIRKKDWNDCED